MALYGLGRVREAKRWSYIQCQGRVVRGEERWRSSSAGYDSFRRRWWWARIASLLSSTQYADPGAGMVGG